MNLKRVGGLMSAVVLVGLAGVGGQVAASPANGEIPARGAYPLRPATLVPLVVMRNAQALAAELQSKVAERLLASERALYDPVIFSQLRYDDILRPRTDDDPLRNPLFGGSGIRELDEEIYNFEVGFRQLLPYGGEGTVGYVARERESTALQQGAEYTGTMTVTLRQPLLKGRGRTATEADLRVVELEHDIDVMRYRDRLLESSGEAVNAYWQLYRAVEALGIRERSLATVQQLQTDIGRRVEGGFAPSTDLLEARIAVSSRRADVTRAKQSVDEVQARLRTLLNVEGSAGRELAFVPVVAPEVTADLGADIDERYQRALESWPQFRIAELRHQQERVRLAFAVNQRMPTLDLTLSYNLNSIGNDADEPDAPVWSVFSATQFNHQDGWFAGVEFEMPVGNRQARERVSAQEFRVQQAALEAQASRNALGHDITTRWRQFHSAREEVEQLQEDVRLREQLLQAERSQYELGRSRLSHVFDREEEVNESRQRLVDSTTRLELARLALFIADGSLLDVFGVAVAREAD